MRKALTIVYFAGYILLIISTLLYILNQHFAVYTFIAAVALVSITRLFLLPKSTDFRIRRLNLIQIFDTLLLIASAYFMWKNNNAWAASLIIAAFLDFYISFRYPKDEQQ